MLLLLIIALICAQMLHAQTTKYEFEVRKGSRCIGNVRLTQIRTGLCTMLTMQSEVKFWLVLQFHATASETAKFQNGILTHCTLWRRQSGSKTINQQTTKSDNIYVTVTDGKAEPISNISTINFHILCMYNTEPLDISEVFVDKIHQMVQIKKIAEHHYRLQLPDGSYNDYFYLNGYCKLVKVHQSFIEIEIVLKSIKQV